MPAYANYALHLLLACVLLAVFFKVYTIVTPFDEVLLIRQGNAAAALSLSGALIGFSLVLASCIIHSANFVDFLMWALVALVLQVLAYLVTTTVMKMSKDHIENGNIAFGGLIGAIALCVGAINAACIF